MKKSIMFLVGLGLVVGLYAIPQAQEALYNPPADGIYMAVGIPDHLVPTIDGDLTDWDWVPDYYRYYKYNFQENTDGTYPEDDDLWVEVIFGWNGDPDRYYFYTKIVDDIHLVTHEPGDGLYWIDDNIMLHADPDGSGGPYKGLDDPSLNFHQAWGWYLALPTPSGEDYYGTEYQAATFADEEPWTKVAWANPSGANYDYEWYVTPWDWLDEAGPDACKIHDIVPGEVVGLDWEYNDVDDEAGWDGDATNMDRRMHCLRTSTKSRPNTQADDIARCMMAPVEERFLTAVEASSWGRVKALFAEK